MCTNSSSELKASEGIRTVEECSLRLEIKWPSPLESSLFVCLMEQEYRSALAQLSKNNRLNFQTTGYIF